MAVLPTAESSSVLARDERNIPRSLDPHRRHHLEAAPVTDLIQHGFVALAGRARFVRDLVAERRRVAAPEKV